MLVALKLIFTFNFLPHFVNLTLAQIYYIIVRYLQNFTIILFNEFVFKSNLS